MVDAVNTVGGVGAGGQPFVRAPAVTVDTSPSTTQDTAKFSLAPKPQTYSTRFFSDPATGVLVTAKLNAEGQSIQQNPSSSVLAYLQDGLTNDGLPKKTTTA